MLKDTILAIESSADETGAAVVRSGKLLSNVVYSQIPLHQKTGGIVPEVAARAHLPKIVPVIRHALAEAGAQLDDVDAIAVTAGPGLITSLMIGVDTAKALAFALDKPIIPINHLEGHLLSGFTLNSRFEIRDSLPALGLVVSGGHTMLVLIKSIGKYELLGETLDDAAGEAFDKIAKLLGLPYPGGPHLAKLAQKGDPKKYDFPRPLMKEDNYNFSFSGLKTAVLYFIRDSKFQIRDSDLAASVEQAIVDALVAKTIKAAIKFKVKTILLGGGVAANKKLQKTLKKEISKNLDSRFYIPDSSLSTDNAGMIALAAWHHLQAGHTTTFDKVVADPNMELKSWKGR